MTTDNRTNEPTEEQAQRATIEYREHFFRRSDGTTRICVCGVTTEGLAEFSEHRMRAALVAAQGAAPQADGAPKSSYISPNLPGMIRNLWKSDPSENSVRTALKLAGDLIQELIDLRAAEGAPSEEQVERAARALAGLEPGEDWPTNSELGGSLTGTRDDEYRDGMRGQARAALTAAGAAPQAATGVGESAELPTETPASWSVGLDPEKVAEVLGAHQCSYGDCHCGWAPTIGDDALPDHQARAVLALIGEKISG